MYQGNFQIIKSELLDPMIAQNDLHDKCCMICLDVATHPVCCTVCKSIYCLKCASIWKSSENNCPKKCQSPWKFSLLDSLNLTLKCPYGEGKCPKSTPETLVDHLQKCESAPAEVAITLKRRRKYLCHNDHLLQFWVGLFQEMINVECDECGETSACRSKCAKCNTKYCVNCRPPPCTKTRCPNGHIYLFGKVSCSYICDICGLRPLSFDQGCYDDIKCNFGMCESCYSRLPEVNELKALKNDYQKCNNQHSLEFLKDSETGICRHCEKEAILQRECKLCDVKFCVKCKPIRINRNATCLKKHRIIHDMSGKICTICRANQSSYQDQQCGLYICGDCFADIIGQAFNLDRVTSQLCDGESHRLRFEENAYQNKHNCFGCKLEKHCPLKCNSCSKNYCIQCRPTKFPKQDYFGHDYVKDIVQMRECFYCDKQSQQTMHCDICLISLCPQCYKLI